MATSRKKASGSKAQKAIASNVTVVEETDDGCKRIIVDPSIDKSCYVEQALADPSILNAIIESLCGEMRRARQFCAMIVAEIAREKPEAIEPSVDHLIDALHRPEAQTRWEALDALHSMVAVCPDKCMPGIEGAEISLWDEDSDPARLAAFNFLCAIGATSPEVSEKVWPNIDEAIQCYHGDIEFPNMLGELIAFAHGNASANVKKELAARMKFDADNGKGVLKNKATAIVEGCNE